MGCAKCAGGYWECDGEGGECSSGAGGKWSVDEDVYLDIPGPGKKQLRVRVQARSRYIQKKKNYTPRLRLTVKGVVNKPNQAKAAVPAKKADASKAKKTTPKKPAARKR